MAEALHVVCPHCGTTNRVPRERLAEGGSCGRCKEPLFAGHPAEVDEAGFRAQVEQSDLPVVVDFWAPWCGPCRAMAPAYEQAARALEPQVRFLKVNTDQEQVLAGRMGIRGIPTLAIFRGGREIARQSGAIDARALTAWVQAKLGA